MMFGLVLSLSILVAAVHIPFAEQLSSVGWYISRSEERLTIEHIEPAKHVAETAAPVTKLNDPRNIENRPSLDASETKKTASRQAEPKNEPDLRRMSGHKILDYAQQMPEIVGGIGAYYIQIEYPDVAIREGIEGRLVLSFIVDIDGETNEIEVLQSLHPACDSAAVRALRRTRFVPGNQNGEPVKVRMHLPVRFQLLPRTGAPQALNRKGDA